MSMSKIALAIPLALGIACSTSRMQSKDHTGAMWTERGDGSAQAQGSSGTQDPSQAGASSSSMGTGSGSSDSTATDSTIALTAGGSSDPGAGGSGGSSETMGTGNPSGSTGSSDQGSGAMGGSDQGATHPETVKGKITKVSSTEISITPKGGTAETLKIGDDTHVMIHGKEAKPSQLKAGQWVQASYETQGADMVATKIVVSSSKQGHKSSSGSHHGTGTSGSGSSGSSGSPGPAGTGEGGGPGGQ